MAGTSPLSRYTQMRTMVLEYLPTKLGSFLGGGVYGKYSSTEHRRFSENQGFPVAELFLPWLIPTKSPTDQKYPIKKRTHLSPSLAKPDSNLVQSLMT